MLDYLPELMKGLHTSLTLTVASIIVALILALIFTIVLTLKTPVLVFKSTSLAYTITLMEVMGHGQLLYGRTYDVMVFGAAGLVYLVVNGLLTLMMRLIERKALAFERRN